MKLDPGERFPDLDLPDHTGRPRRLSELSGGDPVVLLFSRGWWCPKEQGVTELQSEFEVAHTPIVVVSIDAPEVQAAFRAGLGARFVFLSDADRRWLGQLDLLEETDTVHRPYRPTAFTLVRRPQSAHRRGARPLLHGRRPLPERHPGARCLRPRLCAARRFRRARV